MLKRVRRLFLIRTRFEACAVTYAIATGAVSRGFNYMQEYPGPPGRILFLGSLAVVFLAGPVLLDSVASRAK